MFYLKKYYYIYKTTNLINGKIYVGQRSCDCLPEEDSKYLGSGIIFKKSLKKYTKRFFIKEVIEVCFKENLNEREIHWIAFFKAHSPKFTGYNLTDGGQGSNGYRHSEETKNKMSLAKSGKNHPYYNKPCTETRKRNIGNGRRGKLKTELQKQTQSIRMTGAGNHRFGVSIPDIQRVKHSIAMQGEKAPWFGKITTVAKKVNCLEISTNKIITFDSGLKAAKNFNISKSSMDRYIKSEKPLNGFIFSRIQQTA